jgi:membrane dipeptidase
VTTNRGVVMVNFAPQFISEEVRLYGLAVQRRADSLRQTGAAEDAVRDSVRSWNVGAPRATLKQVADHVDHIRRVAGVNHVGLGSDFDGIATIPQGLEDVSKFPDLIAELLRRGWSAIDIRKLVGLNVLRVMRDAERVAGALGAGQ